MCIFSYGFTTRGDIFFARFSKVIIQIDKNIFFYFFRKFCLPSILTSDNNSTWLATRKNDNDLAKSAANKSNQNQSGFIKINQDQTGSIKINQDDNAKWLLKPLNKSETDLVTLTGRLTKIIF